MIKRWMMNDLVSAMQIRRGVNLTGARQVGKTTLTEKLHVPSPIDRFADLSLLRFPTPTSYVHAYISPTKYDRVIFPNSTSSTSSTPSTLSTPSPPPHCFSPPKYDIIPDKQMTAELSNLNDWTSFVFGSDTIRFRTSPRLVRYTRVKKWDNGYLEVGADYGHGEEEEYIDLVPILENLYYDPIEFLKPIKNVEIVYGRR